MLQKNKKYCNCKNVKNGTTKKKKKKQQGKEKAGNAFYQCLTE